MNDVLSTGDIGELMAPRVDKYAKKRKTMSIVPKASIVEANEAAAIIRILGWENKEKPAFAVVKAHYVFDPTIPFANKKKYVTCLGQGCPLCASGNKPSDRYALMVEHMNAKVKDAQGVERNVPTRKILLTGSTAVKQLYVKNTTGAKSLSDQYITATALAGNPSPTYIFEYKGDYNPAYEVNKNDLDNFESLKPDETDAEDAKRLASIANGAKYQPTSFQTQQFNPGYQAAPVSNYQAQHAMTDPWAAPAPVNNGMGANTAFGQPSQVAPQAPAQQNLTGFVPDGFTPTKQPDYTTVAPESQNFDDLPF